MCTTGMPWTQGASGITLLECKSVFANRDGKVWDLSMFICWAGLVDIVRHGRESAMAVITSFLNIIHSLLGI